MHLWNTRTFLKNGFKDAYQLLGGGERGVTLIDTIVGVSIMMVVFIGIAGAFILSLDVITNNKARSGAIALANERIEYIRSIPYTSIGTSGGIPNGVIPQSETTVLNGVSYTRRTYIEYGDDPKDGTGGADANHIIEDFKATKIDVSWTARTGARHIIIASRFEPPSGMEVTCSPCGTLTINAVNAASLPVSGASVTVVNSTTVPPINLTTFTDSTGVATLAGAPVASSYQITVTNTGYSTAQTYSSTAQNTNPNPAHLTVANGQTTTGTFAIDVLGTKTVNTWTQILPGTWNDPFADDTLLATSTQTAVSGGELALSGAPGSYPSSGMFQTITIGPTTIYSWGTFSLATSTPAGTEVTYQLYDGSGNFLIPDAQLPGNSAGLVASTIDLSGISTTTYPSIRFGATLTSSDPSVTPSVGSYTVQYQYGPNPLSDIAFTMQGIKTIGSGPSGAIYKYSQALNSGASASLTIPNLEWDTYMITVNGATTGYDIASSCSSPQPETLIPSASQTTNLYFTAHTANSLLVDVRANATGALLQGASVTLSRTGYSATKTTDLCGQVFFKGLTDAIDYTLTTSAVGYQPSVLTPITASGTSKSSVTLN